MIKFEKVSFKQFKKDCEYLGFDDELLEMIYNDIKLPQRATKGSAGYDFYMPFSRVFMKGESVKFPTGIRCKMDDDVVLLLMPRSSLGFKYKMALNNTIGVIDSDYYNSDNEGHIQCKMHQETEEIISLDFGEAYMQGIFVRYDKVDDDNASETRNGGFGSTNK